MREILFRGKRIDNGEWTYGYLFVCWGRCYLLWGMNGDNPIKEEVYPETVGQYTGLTDKNGKKIFEGDIVQYQPEYEPVPLCSVVVYLADKYNYPAFDLAKHDYEANGLQCAHEERCCEVIGNIHDNPELLQEDGNQCKRRTTMDKEKQIEEMAKVIQGIMYYAPDEEDDRYRYLTHLDKKSAKEISEKLYAAGYRKQSETAREILQMIKDKGLFRYGGYLLHDSDFDTIGKLYGVEVNNEV